MYSRVHYYEKMRLLALITYLAQILKFTYLKYAYQFAWLPGLGVTCADMYP